MPLYGVGEIRIVVFRKGHGLTIVIDDLIPGFRPIRAARARRQRADRGKMYVKGTDIGVLPRQDIEIDG
jgi:hypothetical protein